VRPRCGDAETHIYHVIECPQEQAKQTWEAAINKLSGWLDNNHTQHKLHQVLLEGLRAWHDNRPIQLIPSDWPGVTQTLHDQKLLGWNLFFDGFITDSWVATQQSYLEFLNKKTTGKRWTSRLKSNGCGK
jgi:hypothetical protein